MATRRSTRRLAQGAPEISPSCSTTVPATPVHGPAPPLLSLSSKSTGLPKRDLILLLKKKRLLKASTPQALADIAPHHRSALVATLVFAQSEAGTAFCISPAGLLLTCSHCVSEDPAELETNRIKCLLFASGRVVKARCIAYDHIRDLALLQIIAAEPESGFSSESSIAEVSNGQDAAGLQFHFVSISSSPPKKNVRIICIGHPGDEDLEASKPGVKTNYDVIHVSYGKYRGIAEGADVQDNSEIGALMHDAWTYWGHSGAPLCTGKDGLVVGMHSSWDDETGMRRGISWEAIVDFLRENGDLNLVQTGDDKYLGTAIAPIVLD